MSSKFTLSSMREALDREFAPVVIELENGSVTLQNLMRIDEKPRQEVLAALKTVESSVKDDEQSEKDLEALAIAVPIILKNVCADGRGQELLDALNGDLLLSIRVMEKWTAATQAPEAPSSSA